MAGNSIKNLELFKSLFHCRNDVFAIRWEKGGTSGYMPVYFYDPYRYKVHKMKGGTFKNYPDKSYLPLTDEQIVKHLEGEQLIGIYPLLQDNTSWFIAVDFDGGNWASACKKLGGICHDKKIDAYVERSRSGNGGHIWIFFEKPYPAIRSRKIIISLLMKYGLFSAFDEGSSFDRLFPNQDFLSGKGLGNLIALPMNNNSLSQGNNCFVDMETLKPFNDQWEFLRKINRTPVAVLDELYRELENQADTHVTQNTAGNLFITLDNQVHIARSGMPGTLINFLIKELNFLNSEFIVKTRLGKNTWNTDRYFRFIEETENEVVIPKGMAGKVLRFCKQQNIEYEFVDKRKKHLDVVFNSNIRLREYQEPAFEATSKKDIGVIVAPPGSGKTIIGLKIIAEKQQPALIIVHRKQLADQWIERIQSFLGIPKHEIGKIGQGKCEPGKIITIGMIQSLSKCLEKADNHDLINAFGTIIIDECHHIPAAKFRNTISQLNSYYLYGLTSTPFRKYNDGRLIFIHLGDIISELKLQDVTTARRAQVIIRNTDLDVPFNSRTDSFETLSKILIHDSARNKLILKDIITELNNGKKVVVITERKEHIESLYQYLKQSFEVITLSGEDNDTLRKQKWEILKEGNFQVLITTGQYFGEGSDLNNIQSLFLVYPFSFKGKLVQYIGRVQRTDISPIIYDYRDIKIEYLNKLFLSRNAHYRKLDQHPSLFDEPIYKKPKSKDTFTFDKTIKIPIEKLEFRYGLVTFNYKIPDIDIEIKFEIENLEIRPEFDVLKPYFRKVLKTKNIKADIFTEFENGKLVSQLAASKDLEKINREIIESVKFRYIKGLPGKRNNNFDNNLLDINQIQFDGDNRNVIYNNEEELLEDILQYKNVKHHLHLQYLAAKHDNSVLKIRFFLSPFSFVFLITGEKQYHIILETLDIEEATYIWHFKKDRRQLSNYLKEVERDLFIIRVKGREEFIKLNPSNFSRLIHDYSEERKGFILWRDILEERLV